MALLQAFGIKKVVAKNGHVEVCLTSKEVEKNPLLKILFEDGPLYLYKLVNASNNEGIIKPGIKYEVGKEVEEDSVDTNPYNINGAGVNVGTLKYMEQILRANKHIGPEDVKLLKLEFKREDIGCITFDFEIARLFRAKVVEELDPRKTLKYFENWKRPKNSGGYTYSGGTYTSSSSTYITVTVSTSGTTTVFA
jgi:hypothetical protein